MTPQEARKLTERTIRWDLRHPHYTRIKEIEKFCKQAWNEDSHKDIILDKKPEFKKQINKIFQIYTPCTRELLNPIKNLYEKMHASDNIKKELSHKDENRGEEIRDSAGRYFGNLDLEGYLEDNFVEWQFSSPNSWHITERLDIRRNDNSIESIQVYPFIVSAAQAINYEFDETNQPKWLIVQQERTEFTLNDEGDEVKEDVKDFYFYAAGMLIVYRGYVNEKPENLARKEFELTEIKNDNYLIEEWETNSKTFPGKKVGAIRDTLTDASVRIPVYWGAKGAIIDAIKHKLEKDVQENKHVFPKRHQFVDKCTHQSPEYGTCEGGYYEGDKNHKCDACDGTGYNMPKNSSEAEFYEFPDNIEDARTLPKLSDFVFYEDIPVESVEYYGNELLKDAIRIQVAMFNVAVSEKPVSIVAKTATEIDAEERNANNPVSKVANKFSEVLCHAYQIVSEYHGYEEGLVNFHRFNKDLKLEPLNVLINRLSSIKETGADSNLQFSLECDIAQKQLDSSGSIALMKAKRALTPFSDIPFVDAMAIVSSRDRSDRDRVFLENRHRIWTEIEMEYPDFALSEWKLQKSIVDDKIEEISTSISNRKEVNLFTETLEDEALEEDS